MHSSTRIGFFNFRWTKTHGGIFFPVVFLTQWDCGHKSGIYAKFPWRDSWWFLEFEKFVIFFITVSTVQSNCTHVPAEDSKASPFEVRRIRPRNLYLKAVWSSGCCVNDMLLIYGVTNFTCFCTWVTFLPGNLFWNLMRHKFSWWDAMHQHPSECLLIPTCKVKSLQGVYVYARTMHLNTSRGQSMWVTGKVTSSTAKLSRIQNEVRVDPNVWYISLPISYTGYTLKWGDAFFD